MKKSILIAALGLFSLSTMAQDAKPEEGFVFTTRTKTVRALAGVSQLSDSLNQNCYV